MCFSRLDTYTCTHEMIQILNCGFYTMVLLQQMPHFAINSIYFKLLLNFNPLVEFYNTGSFRIPTHKYALWTAMYFILSRNSTLPFNKPICHICLLIFLDILIEILLSLSLLPKSFLSELWPRKILPRS